MGGSIEAESVEALVGGIRVIKMFGTHQGLGGLAGVCGFSVVPQGLVLGRGGETPTGWTDTSIIPRERAIFIRVALNGE